MIIEFADRQGLERAEKDPRFDAGLGPTLIRAYRDKVDFLRSCHSEQDIREMKSLHFEKLKGKRNHQRSIMLKHDAKRLIFQFINRNNQTIIQIDEVGDYH